MFGRIAHTPGVKLVAPGRFTSEPVWVSTVQPRWVYRLVGIQHDSILGHFVCYSDIVIDHPLTIMMLAPGNNPAHVSCFDRVVSVLLHEADGFVHPALIVCR